jgi:hypothetical protein
MELNLRIKVADNFITVDCPEINVRGERANLVGIEIKSGRIVSFGETPEQLEQYYPENWKKHKHEVRFEKIFDSNNFDVDIASSFIIFTVGELQEKAPWYRLLNLFNLELYFASYELISNEAQDKFEFEVQTNLHLGNLEINRKKVVDAGWNYKISSLALKLDTVFYVLPLILLPRVQSESLFKLIEKIQINPTIATLIALFTSMAISYLCFLTVWVLATYYLLPKKLIQWIVISRNKNPNTKKGRLPTNSILLILVNKIIKAESHYNKIVK